MSFRTQAKYYTDPEKMAADYLAAYFDNSEITYPINPFRMLRDEGILFTLSDFHKLEGVYIAPTDSSDVATVGINANRPITRQRYTAAHELCHHFHDTDKQIACPIIGVKNSMEKFADAFAAAVLMPLSDLRIQVNKRKDDQGYISFDDVLMIAYYFGVSFETCLYRIAYRIHAIDGDTSPQSLKKRCTKYKPDKIRKSRHLTYEKLYTGLIDNYQEALRFHPSDYARYIFQNEYIYNDSRMEGVGTTLEQASEIVTDLRLHGQNSIYCNEKSEAFMSIAGHYEMYRNIFAEPVKDKISVFDTIGLNKKLFSYYPYPEYGGTLRQNNTLVLGAKFETVDYHDILNELAKLDISVKENYARRESMPMSEYIRHVVRVHHRLTVIHPFGDGNGRTMRAFMNMQFVRAGLPPVYIKVKEKKEYVAALARADKDGCYDELEEFVERLILISQVKLNH